MKAIEDILIVGGGTAGWLTAAFLAQHLGTAHGGVRITLVEASDIGIIGVGEGTFPSIRGTLSAIGISESRFLQACSATFKQGVQFNDWVRPPVAERGPEQRGSDHYFHPFSLPSQRPGAPELLPYWLMGDAGPDRAFAEAVTLQKAVVDARHGPKRAGDGDFQGALNYAYHFDAGRFAVLLAEQAQSLGVKRVIATVDQVALDEQGAIEAVHTREAGVLRAGLYVDCSGFHARLIGQALGSAFKPLKDVLFVDRALAMQVPYERPDAPIASCTMATAQHHGWIWDIGLQERRGIGHVYSSRHTDDESAERELRHYIGPAAQSLTPRKLTLNVGYRETQWVKNCVAVGLSGGFLEPLESSGIGLIETAAYLIAQLFPFDGDTEPVARHFNRFMSERYARIVDFIKMHYALTQRRDTRFWRDNADPSSMPDSLRDKLAMWRHRPPQRLDFITDVEMYLPASWQYVLYGMEYETRLEGARAGWRRSAEAQQEFRMIAQLGQHAVRDLPRHRELIELMLSRAGLKMAA
ncbi:tryptophan 7-halogenase [Roseateles sp. SL47]|uniref:tryptophan halogenase family protein n=1 Tax=Roseateles sp. SL47 TaxID=2995138 RepID=UPI0022709155|nr:tryptophan halogenase family protein [Roseateles sp. SL47]WAC74504.1 tryptophan 7-halogenase [Roseateles sp. SL47]